MILLVGGWYFIVCGVCTLLPLLLGIESETDYLGWISAPLLLAVGIGLLKRTTWSRWMAFGMTLVGWTLGTLCLVFFLYFIFGRLGLDLDHWFSAIFSKGPLKVVARLGLLAFILWVAGIVISFKLFWYLWSPDGCAEFNEPFGSTHTVAASTAVWILGWLGLLATTGDLQRGWQGMKLAWELTDSDNGMFGDRRDRKRDRYEQSDAERARQEMRDRQLRKATDPNYRQPVDQERERREQTAREQIIREQRAREILEAAQRAEQLSANSVNYQQPAATQQPSSNEFEMPSNYGSAQSGNSSANQGSATQEETTADSSKILKCRDASGSITFTQNYCPPGTQLVQSSP